jgi:hypothetical protein
MATVKTEAGYFAIHIRETLAPEIFAAIAAAAATTAQTQASGGAIPPGWLFRRNADGSIGIFSPPVKLGESPRTSDVVYPFGGFRDLHELLGKLADHQAAQPQAEPVAQGLTDAAVLDWLELADSVTIGRNRADETTEVVAIFGDQPIISEHESLRASVRAALSTGEPK